MSSDPLPNITPDGSDDDSSEPPQTVTPEEMLDVLTNGRFDTEHGAIRWSSNYTFLLTVAHKNKKVLAVYKPQSGERPLWDFPDGTLCYRERAAYVTSEALGWDVVPPTVLRKDAPRGLGSVQFYVDHDPNHHYFNFDSSMMPQLQRLALFDAIVNNADRKGGHCIVDERGHLWGIDHGLTFHPANKLRTVIWDFSGKPVPQHLLDDLQKLCAALDDTTSAYRVQLDPLIEPSEIKALTRRVHRILASGCYPEPGPGPNYPWPPV